jgi:hypothetical protein
MSSAFPSAYPFSSRFLTGALPPSQALFQRKGSTPIAQQVQSLHGECHNGLGPAAMVQENELGALRCERTPPA